MVKKNIYNRIIAYAVASFVCMACLAFDYECEGLYYNFIYNSESYDDVSLELTSNADSPYTGNVIVPDYVPYKEMVLPVVRIRKDAFSGSLVESVTIPSTVEQIDTYAFFQCYNLKHVYGMPSTVTDWSGMFYCCLNLEDIDIPEGVEIIYHAFDSCYKLRHVVIPSSVRDMTYSFHECYGLEKAEIAVNDERLLPIKMDYAFYECKKLAKVNLPYSETTGQCTFGDCKSLTSIVIPADINLGFNTFGFCDNLKEVIVEDGVEKKWIYCNGRQTFAECPIEHLYLGRDFYTTYTNDDEALFTVISSSTRKLTIGKSETMMIGDFKKAKFDINIDTIVCTRLEPNVIPDTIFTNKMLLFTTLVVPDGSVELYKQAEGWKHFKRIVTESEAMDVKVIESEERVRIEGNDIVVSSVPKGRMVSLYGLGGELKKTVMSDGTPVRLATHARGVYIIYADGNAHKCVVY